MKRVMILTAFAACVLLVGCGHPLYVRDPEGQPIAGVQVLAQGVRVSESAVFDPTGADGRTVITDFGRHDLAHIELRKEGYFDRVVPGVVLLNQNPALVVLQPVH